MLDSSVRSYITNAAALYYRIAGIFRGCKVSRMDHYKGFRGFYFRGLSSSLLAHAHINICMQLYLHTVSLESIILNSNTPTIHKFSWV